MLLGLRLIRGQDCKTQGSELFLPRPRHEDLLKEHLGEVEHGDQGEEAGELEEGVEVLGHLGVDTETVLRSQ